MLQKKVIITFILISLVGIIIAVVAFSPKSTSTVRLNLAHFFPATHPVEKILIPKWIEAVEEATGGQVKVTSYPGETLAKASDMYSGVVSGIADIGISCFSYTRGRFPVLEVFELPGITYLNSKVSSKVAWEGINRLNPEEVQDTHLLMTFTTGPGHLLTRVPIRNLEDLKGVEIRATGLSAKTLQVLGAVPVAMAQPETYEALSRGIVKGNLSPSEVLQGWRHAEVTSYTTITPFLYNTLFFMTVNLDTWNSLSPNLQKAISEANQRVFEEVAIGLWDDQNNTALNWAVSEKGMQKIDLSPAETQRWIDQVVSIQNEYTAKMDAMGLDGKAILNTVKELADKYNQEYGDNMSQ